MGYFLEKERAIKYTNTGARSLICVVGLAWGFNWVVTRLLLQSLAPFTLRTLAIAFGAIMLFGIATLKRQRIDVPRGQRIKVAVAGFFNVTVFNACSAYSQVFGSTSRAVVVAYSMPIWAFLLARWQLNEKAGPTKLIAVGLCACGSGVLLYPGSGQGFPLGTLFALASAWSWAIGTVYQKRASLTIPLLCSTAWQLLLGGAVLAVGMFALDGAPHLTRLYGQTAVLLGYSGFLAMGVAYLLWFVALDGLPATTAAIGTLLVPVVGVAISVLMNGERPSVNDAVGFLLIFVAAAGVLLEPGNGREDVNMNSNAQTAA